VLLEAEAQIEDWLPQRASGAQQECDEQPAKAAAAVEEGVNRLLALPEFARLFVAAPFLRQKDFMDLADEP
jgi:hypothetical protein